MKTLVSKNFFISCHNGFTMLLMTCMCYSIIILYNNKYKQHQHSCHWLRKQLIATTTVLFYLGIAFQ